MKKNLSKDSEVPCCYISVTINICIANFASMYKDILLLFFLIFSWYCLQNIKKSSVCFLGYYMAKLDKDSYITECFNFDSLFHWLESIFKKHLQRTSSGWCLNAHMHENKFILPLHLKETLIIKFKVYNINIFSLQNLNMFTLYPWEFTFWWKCL